MPCLKNVTRSVKHNTLLYLALDSTRQSQEECVGAERGTYKKSLHVSAHNRVQKESYLSEHKGDAMS